MTYLVQLIEPELCQTCRFRVPVDGGHIKCLRKDCDNWGTRRIAEPEDLARIVRAEEDDGA